MGSWGARLSVTRAASVVVGERAACYFLPLGGIRHADLMCAANSRTSAVPSGILPESWCLQQMKNSRLEHSQIHIAGQPRNMAKCGAGVDTNGILKAASCTPTPANNILGTC